MKATCLKIIDLPADDPRRTFIDAAIDTQITEALTPERVFAVTQCALLRRDEESNVECKKLGWQITMQVKKALIPKDERKTEADVQKWVQIIMGKYWPLVTAAVHREIDAAIIAGRITRLGDKYRIRPARELKSRCRTKTKPNPNRRRPQ
jgi:hypothetical protein